MAAEKVQTQVRQEQIAQAALELVAQSGMGKLSVAGVAKRVGLTPSGIYRHYASKDQVLDAALELIHDRLIGNVRWVCAQEGGVLQRLESLLMRHARLVESNQGIARLIFSEELHSERQRKGKVYRIIQDYLQRVADLIRSGQQDYTIRADLDPDAAALLFLGMVQPAALLWHVSDGRFKVVEHAEQSWRIFREAIAARQE